IGGDRATATPSRLSAYPHPQAGLDALAVSAPSNTYWWQSDTATCAARRPVDSGGDPARLAETSPGPRPRHPAPSQASDSNAPAARVDGSASELRTLRDQQAPPGWCYSIGEPERAYKCSRVIVDPKILDPSVEDG